MVILLFGVDVVGFELPFLLMSLISSLFANIDPAGLLVAKATVPAIVAAFATSPLLMALVASPTLFTVDLATLPIELNAFLKLKSSRI